MALPPNLSTLYSPGRNSSHSTTLTGTSMRGSVICMSPFLANAVPGVQIDERDGVRSVGPESRPEQRHAHAVGAVGRLGGRSRDVDRQHRRTRREHDLHERLGAVADAQRHLGQRPSLFRDERRRYSTLGDGGEDGRIGKARNVQRQRRRPRRSALIAEGGQERLACGRCQRRVDFADVHAPETGDILRRNLQRARRPPPRLRRSRAGRREWLGIRCRAVKEPPALDRSRFRRN